jgi:5-methylthioadenosine/S-adenosylhomocysteine deaminase
MWAIRGRLVPLSSDLTVAPNEAAVFTGRVWVGDDGTIVAVTKGSNAGPPGSADAEVVTSAARW